MNLAHALDAATATRVPALIWGPPGVGKSAAVRRWAAQRGLRCWTVIASLREPADFGGLPILLPERAGDAGGDPSVIFAPPRFAVEAGREGGVIFLDELTTAPPAVQAALLRAVVDRAFGDLELDPDRVTIIAAANPVEEAAGGWDLAPPLANRFMHITFPVSAEEWANAFPSYWGAPSTLSFGGRAVPEQAWAEARAVVAAFIRVRPPLLLQVPKDAASRAGAWPSPRTWDYVSRLLTNVGFRCERIEDVAPLIMAAVGEGPASEFLAWLRELDLPDPEELLRDPSSYRHPDRADVAYAVLTAICHVTLARLSPERWLAAWTVLAAAAGQGAVDVAAVAARSLARARSAELPVPKEQLAAFVPVLEAAGMLKPAGRPGVSGGV